MSSAKIEEVLQYWKGQLEEDPNDLFAKWRVDEFEEILKERAEAGTYHDDFTDQSGHATARQGR
jgi:hypothetical protein